MATLFTPGNHRIVWLIALSMFSSCLSDTFKGIEDVTAGPEIAAPIGKVHFKMMDFLEQDSLISVNQDGLLEVVYRKDSATSLALDQFLDDLAGTWAFSFADAEEIGPIEIDDQSIDGAITLNQFVSQMSGTIRQFFQNNNGSSLAIPAFNENVNLSYNLPPFPDFSNMVIENGRIVVNISNNFPFRLQNLELVLRNRSDNTVITRLMVNQIEPGETLTRTADLAGKEIENRVEAFIEVFTSNGTSGPTLINLDDELNLAIKLEDISIASGSIVPPAYVFDPYSQFVDLNLSSADKVYTASIATGKVNYLFDTELAIPMELSLEFPSITIDGNIFSATIPVNGTTTGTIDFSGAEVDLTLDPVVPFNRIEVKTRLQSLSSGQLIPFDAKDSIRVNIDLEELEFNSLTGNLAAASYELEANTFDFGIDFSFLDPSTEPIFFENPIINVFYKNSFGFPMEADLDVSTTGAFNDQADLNPPVIQLDYPNIGQLGQTIEGEFLLDKNNANLVNFLSVYPGSIDYQGEVRINTQDPDEIHFVTPDSKLKVGFEIKLPLSLDASRIVFEDTITSEPLGEEPDLVESATLVIDFLNRLPFEGRFQLIGFLPGNNPVVILEDLIVPGADVDNQGKITGSKDTRSEIVLSSSQIVDLFTAERLEVRVEMNTVNAGNQFVSIYTDDGLEIGIGLRAKLNIK